MADSPSPVASARSSEGSKGPRAGRLDLRNPKLRVQTFLWLWAVRVGLSLLPFSTVLRLQRQVCARKLRARMESGDSSTPDLGARHVDRVAWVVERQGRVVPGAKCLARALAGQVLLAHRGVATELCIGAQRDPHKGIQAHAWLEREGIPILGGGDLLEHFTPLAWGRDEAR